MIASVCSEIKESIMENIDTNHSGQPFHNLAQIFVGLKLKIVN